MSSPPQCLVLDGSTPCGPAFSSWPVLSQFFPTISDFSSAIHRLSGTGDDFASYLSQSSMCSASETKSALKRLRYQSSVWCASVVSDAISAGCAAPSTTKAPTPLLCTTSCSEAISSLSSILTNDTVCPLKDISQDAAVTRNSTLSTLQGYCNTAKAALTANSSLECIVGTPTETRLCGWTEQILAVSQCMTRPNDPCCQKFINDTAPALASSTIPVATHSMTSISIATSTTTRSAPTSTSTSTSTATSTPSASNVSSSSSATASGMNPVIFLVLAVILGVLLLIAVGLFIMYRRRKQKIATAANKGLFEPMMDTPLPPGDMDQKLQTLSYRQSLSLETEAQDKVDNKKSWKLPEKRETRIPVHNDKDSDSWKQELLPPEPPRKIMERKSSRPPPIPDHLRNNIQKESRSLHKANVPASNLAPIPDLDEETNSVGNDTPMSANIPLSNVLDMKRKENIAIRVITASDPVEQSIPAGTISMLQDFGAAAMSMATPVPMVPPTPHLKDQTLPSHYSSDDLYQHEFPEAFQQVTGQIHDESTMISQMTLNANSTQSMMGNPVYSTAENGTGSYMALYPSYVQPYGGFDVTQTYMSDQNVSMIFVPQAMHSTYSLAGPNPYQTESDERHIIMSNGESASL